MSQRTSCSLAILSHSDLLGDVRNATSFGGGGVTFPIQKASKHTVKLLVNPPHPSHPFLQEIIPQIFLTLLSAPAQEQMSFDL